MSVSLATATLALDVRITGNMDEDLTAAVEGGSILIEQSNAEELPDAREIVSAAQADYKRILAVLYANSYFGPTISVKLDGQEAANILAVSPPSRVTQATIQIDTGPPFRFGVADVAPLQRRTEVPDAFQSGERASISALQAARGAAVDGWRDAGHAKAEISSQEITARHDKKQLDVRLQVSPGPRLRFGALQISGESAVRRERILEIASLPEGEQFAPEELADAAARLRRTGAFRAVALIEEDVASDGETIPITARVADNKPRRFGFGGELASIEGATVTGYWLHRNFLGGAERLRIDGEISGIGGSEGVGGDTGGTDYRLRTRFDRPATFNEDTDLYLLGEIDNLDEPNYQAREVKVEAGIERIASDERTYRLGVGYQRALTEDVLGKSNYTLLLLPTGATFDYRDNELDARRGYYADASVTPFYAVTGTDSGLLSEIDLRGYQTFGSSNPTTLALRLQIGSVAGPSLTDAPADFLFYSGGGGTVRGQDYESLGVRVGSGEDDIIGGRSFLGLSAEVRARTEGALGFVGFFDAGYIGSEAFPDGSGNWQSGAGLGVRYATPIGPIRFDVAFPVSGDTEGENFYVYFGIGHAF